MTPERFCELYPPLAPARSPGDQDESRRLTISDGVHKLGPPEPERPNRAVPTKSGDPGCHLWTIELSGVPYILEYAAISPPLKSGRVTHTNLTGGDAASCGGEFWFDPADDEILYVNGCSGRYGPRTPQHLDDAADVLGGFGYKVDSFGWDWDADKPARVRR